MPADFNYSNKVTTDLFIRAYYIGSTKGIQLLGTLVDKFIESKENSHLKFIIFEGLRGINMYEMRSLPNSIINILLAFQLVMLTKYL